MYHSLSMYNALSLSIVSVGLLQLLILVRTIIWTVPIIYCLVEELQVLYQFSAFILIHYLSPDQGATTVLGYHTMNGGMTPSISAEQYNPVRDRNTGGCPPAPPVSLQACMVDCIESC